jgi:phage shock protein A
MAGFLDKLNVLVKSSLNNFLGGAADQPAPGLPRVPAARLGKDIDKEIAALRKRIEEALSEEDAMQKRLEASQQQIKSYDQQADQALKGGDEPTARYLIQQMRRQEQLEAMLRAELVEHRQSTSDFIQRVNMLDAIVSDARREQQSGSTEATEAQPDRTPGAILSNLLRDARERFESTIPSAQNATSAEQSAKSSDQAALNDQQLDDDLAKRRARLSKDR